MTRESLPNVSLARTQTSATADLCWYAVGFLRLVDDAALTRVIADDWSRVSEINALAEAPERALVM